jgi:CRP-like cAMP-binding protein
MAIARIDPNFIQMLEPLLKYIESHSESPLTASDIVLIREAFVPRKLRKRQFLLQEGDVCKYISFIVSGATRQYTVDEKGKEHILNLCIENWWASDRESFHKETPSIYNIDAWEETQVLMLPKANGCYQRVNEIPAFREMRMKLDDNNFMAGQKRLLTSINATAENKYEEFAKSHPEFLQRFPQHLIASYLGITKETLSRIRSQSLRNS